MDTHATLEAIVKFVRELGYEYGDREASTPKSLQCTIEQLAADLEVEPSQARVSY